MQSEYSTAAPYVSDACRRSASSIFAISATFVIPDPETILAMVGRMAMPVP